MWEREKKNTFTARTQNRNVSNNLPFLFEWNSHQTYPWCVCLYTLFYRTAHPVSCHASNSVILSRRTSNYLTPATPSTETKSSPHRHHLALHHLHLPPGETPLSFCLNKNKVRLLFIGRSYTSPNNPDCCLPVVYARGWVTSLFDKVTELNMATPHWGARVGWQGCPNFFLPGVAARWGILSPSPKTSLHLTYINYRHVCCGWCSCASITCDVKGENSVKWIRIVQCFYVNFWHAHVCVGVCKGERRLGVVCYLVRIHWPTHRWTVLSEEKVVTTEFVDFFLLNDNILNSCPSCQRLACHHVVLTYTGVTWRLVSASFIGWTLVLSLSLSASTFSMLGLLMRSEVTQKRSNSLMDDIHWLQSVHCNYGWAH